MLSLVFSLYRDQLAFYNFVNAIRADGGGDSAEDIMGGLQAAFSRLSWGDEEVVKVKKIILNLILPTYLCMS